MSGWHILVGGAVPMFGTLLFLKMVADAIYATGEDLHSLEEAEETAFRQRKQRAADSERKRKQADAQVEVEVVSSPGGG